MSVLIKGMEMPKDKPLTLVIYPDGTVANVYEYQRGTAVHVPPHGDLIDRDALPWENQGFMLTDPDEWGLKAWDIEHAPTVIPADKEGDNG